MTTAYTCGVCCKKSEYEGLVWYTQRMPETNLCRSHYRKWCKHHRNFMELHKDTKPCTKEWEQMCSRETTLFMKWFNREKDLSGGDVCSVKS